MLTPWSSSKWSLARSMLVFRCYGIAASSLECPVNSAHFVTLTDTASFASVSFNILECRYSRIFVFNCAPVLYVWHGTARPLEKRHMTSISVSSQKQQRNVLQQVFILRLAKLFSLDFPWLARAEYNIGPSGFTVGTQLSLKDFVPFSNPKPKPKF